MMPDTTFLQAVLTNFASLAPVKIVRSYQQGVRFTFGDDKALLYHGVHWYVPFFQSIEILDTVPQVVNLPTQSLLTKDDISICVSSAIEYEVRNARKLYSSIQDTDKTLVNTGMGYLGKGIRTHTYDDTRNRTGDLETIIKQQMNAHVNPWGVKINEFYITDLTKAYQLRTFSDTNPGLKPV